MLSFKTIDNRCDTELVLMKDDWCYYEYTFYYENTKEVAYRTRKYIL